MTVSLALATAPATGGSGSDTLKSIENLIGTAFADKLGGNADANALAGEGGADTLDGGAGSDTMSGSDGIDYYYVRGAGDVVIETNTSTSATEADYVDSYLAADTLGTNVEWGRTAGRPSIFLRAFLVRTCCCARLRLPATSLTAPASISIALALT